MIFVTIDCGAVRDKPDLQLAGRIQRGLMNLEKEGFRVERFDKFGDEREHKYMFTVLGIKREGEKDA